MITTTSEILRYILLLCLRLLSSSVITSTWEWYILLCEKILKVQHYYVLLSFMCAVLLCDLLSYAIVSMQVIFWNTTRQIDTNIPYWQHYQDPQIWVACLHSYRACSSLQLTKNVMKQRCPMDFDNHSHARFSRQPATWDEVTYSNI